MVFEERRGLRSAGGARLFSSSAPLVRMPSSSRQSDPALHRRPSGAYYGEIPPACRDVPRKTQCLQRERQQAGMSNKWHAWHGSTSQVLVKEA